MAENNYPMNNGQSPFRRYEPTASNGAGNGNVTPLSKSPTAGHPSPSTPRVIPRRRRNNRSRWRQWVQSTPPQLNTDRQRGSASSAGAAAGANSAGESRRTLQSPLDALQSPRPPALTNQPSQYVQEPNAQGAYQPRAQAPQQRHQTASARGQRQGNRPPQPRRAPRSQTAQRPSGKVTPLRNQPIWSSPTDDRADNASQHRDRKPRRPSRKTPQPVLYGIRLLILGTGIAAILGTIISSFSANQEASISASSGSSQEQTAVSALSPRNGSPALNQPLPLAEELVSVETDLVALEAMTPGLDQSVFFYDTATGNYIDLNGATKVAAASTIKMPILVAFLQAVDAGTVRLDQAITLREDMIASGSGDMQFDEPGTQYTALEVATEMIVNSDNTATNLIIGLLGGLEPLNQQFRSWGLESTVLQNLLPDLDGTNTTSAADLVRVMALVDQGNLLSLRSRDRLFGIMQRTYNRSLIPDGLTDESALTYNKTGDIGTSLGDIALVDVANGNRYILGVLVTRPFNDGRASELIRRVSGRVHEAMNQPVNPLGAGMPENSPADATTQPVLESEEGSSEPPGTVVPVPEALIETEPSEPVPYIEPGSEPTSGPDSIPPG